MYALNLKQAGKMGKSTINLSNIDKSPNEHLLHSLLNVFFVLNTLGRRFVA
jgi:hypothetical protein